jgi:hypothetical protein
MSRIFCDDITCYKDKNEICCKDNNVTYITTAPTATTIPTGGTEIPTNSTTIPSGTVTTIIGYNTVPITNIGGIILNNTITTKKTTPSSNLTCVCSSTTTGQNSLRIVNGQFVIPIAGIYNISATVSFYSKNAPGNITLYIYKISATMGVIILLAANTVPSASIFLSLISLAQAPNSSIPYDTVMTTTILNAGDRIFFAATQNTSESITTTADNRFVITRVGDF